MILDCSRWRTWNDVAANDAAHLGSGLDELRNLVVRPEGRVDAHLDAVEPPVTGRGELLCGEIDAAAELHGTSVQRIHADGRQCLPQRRRCQRTED